MSALVVRDYQLLVIAGLDPAIHVLPSKMEAWMSGKTGHDGENDLDFPMRPALLNPLFAPVTSLPGVGPKQDKLLRYLLGRDETPRLVDLLLHLPASVIDRRAQPKIRDAVQGTVVTLEVTVDRHRPPPPRNSRAPLSGLCQRRYRRRGADVLPRQARLCRKAAAGRREALRFRHAADVRRHPADRASRPRRRRGRICKTQRHRSGLSPDRRPGAGLAAPRDRAGAAETAGSAGMDQPGSHPPLQLSADPRSAATACMCRSNSPTSCPMVRSGRGSPSTNCWPANWRWRWCARSCGVRPATATPATAICATRSSTRCPMR